MSIEPFISCSDVQKSVDFYSRILDFTVVLPPDPDPEAFMSRYSLLKRDGNLVHLSSHRSDGVFGNSIYVRVKDIEPLYIQFIENGLNDSDDGNNPGVRIKPVTQTWGMREFCVMDPDGNRITFGHSVSS